MCVQEGSVYVELGTVWFQAPTGACWELSPSHKGRLLYFYLLIINFSDVTSHRGKFFLLISSKFQG